MAAVISRILGGLLILALVAWTLISGFILEFIYFYPLIMAMVWMIGGTYFFIHWERNNKGPDTMPELKKTPLVSILIPCYNESKNVAETIKYACQQNYPNIEVLAANDGSTDNTGEILDGLMEIYPNLRVIQFTRNQGKAMALNMMAMAAQGDYFVCIDSDAVMHPNMVAHIVKPMIDNPRVGAVTGNPRVRTRSSLIGRVQVGEFSSIIGLIKRSQRIYGQVFTVSGVVAAFRRRALHECGYWDPNMSTEDIDISWSLQLRHWQIQYEASAIVWILMPETLRGLWKQRLRWAQGGAEVFFKNFLNIWRWHRRRMWMLVLDFCFSTTWTYAYAISIALYIAGKYVQMPMEFYVPTIWPPAYWGLMLATVSLLQFTIAMIIETRYERGMFSTLFWVIWYPLFFWVLSLVTTFAGFPRALLRPIRQRALWHTEDRGFR